MTADDEGTAGTGRRPMRLAAGRARDRGLPTRGTTAPDRLRRVDRWIVHVAAPALRAANAPVVVDLGYGESAITTLQLARALASLRDDIEVVGVENDRFRVTAAQPAAVAGVSFRYGSFDVDGLRPTVIRVMNVLRQYDEPAVGPAWNRLASVLAPGGLVVEGTCDEQGRRGSWVTLDATGPIWFTVGTHLPSLSTPGDLAPRLPKALIHRNVRGERVHAFLAAADEAWARTAPHAAFGPRQRWSAMCLLLREDGWPVRDGPRRWRLGELALPWAAVAPG